MSEAQEFEPLQSFLKGISLNQYDAMVGMTTSTNGGITYGAESVKDLIINYTQA